MDTEAFSWKNLEFGLAIGSVPNLDSRRGEELLLQTMDVAENPN